MQQSNDTLKYGWNSDSINMYKQYIVDLCNSRMAHLSMAETLIQ